MYQECVKFSILIKSISGLQEKFTKWPFSTCVLDIKLLGLFLDLSQRYVR